MEQQKAEDFFKQSRKASKAIARLNSTEKAKLLTDLAELIEKEVEEIKVENKKDLDRMETSDPKYDRLLLTDERIAGLSNSLRTVAKLEDPVGKVLLEKTLPNGLKLSKIADPLGVVGIIYESRPNVTVDVASLCLRSGNAAILKGGKEAHFSNTYLVSLIHKVLSNNGLPTKVVTLLPTDRSYTAALLNAEDYVDVIIPRGSAGLINYVRENSMIPTIETGAGVCHTYVEKTGNPSMAAAILVNAKVTRPSVCNSLDCAVLDEEVLETVIPQVLEGFKEYDVEVYADEKSYPVFEKNGYTKLKKASSEDFGKEWLDYKVSFKTVNGIDEALEHIEENSSRHSEAIITENSDLAIKFIKEVDAASVYHNASTRFTDGEEFGLGAEIGISTQKLHARGPFALEKLVTEKWVVLGKGQIR
ncbi:glutamate-5-semialdehyde dehydrogenase [Jiulongibacter sediminis]|uniref:Gamma-glutamyl phosphate reductase n=1 Tax=Jiulongibacter sediminis TaxID=1605367 RepID=A0A0P7C1F6_9BACT|nr:glutamate-5-semialdehyde dehydrogenase [Jiulongibacter sediminis]KPM47829.1 gamma-glutamyl phosphate reductase [Jiulongibacter sediminis]TBX24014.1 gamma-glutamyl phosphate reductase [Jiulongibacter sediminis]